MPTKAPTIRSCGCRVSYGGMCAHIVVEKRRINRAYDKRRPSATARGYDGEWQRKSKAYLAEPGNERCACGAPATMVGHCIAIKFAPHLRMERSNWKPSCTPCNLRQSIKSEGGWGKQPTGGGHEL